MSCKFVPRVVLSIALAIAAVVPMSGTSLAAGGTGKVINYHLNGNRYGRTVCVRTSPALPGTGWACVWYRDQLTKEYGELLLHAYINGKTCTFQWDTTDVDGHGLVDLIECD
jgi:hypothetical protein